MHSPQALTAGARIANPFLKGGAGAGAHLPLLVPNVDGDGNEGSGIRLPEVAVPLATYTAWNFRAPAVGAPDRLYPLLGSYIPFTKTKAEREERKDPRPSLAQRYPTRDVYLAKIRGVTSSLVKDRFLLPEDVEAAVSRANANWDLVMNSRNTSR